MLRLLTLVLISTLWACVPQVGPSELETDDERIGSPKLQESFGDSRRPQVCASGTFLYAVWTDDRALDSRIRLNRSIDGGLNWLPTDVLVSADTPQGHHARNPSIACEQGRVSVAWEDDRDGPLGNPGIYVNVSQDAGANWPQESSSITTDLEGDWRSLEPRIAMFGSDVYVVWYDGRAGAFDIYFQHGVLRGLDLTWLIEELRLDRDTEGAAYSARPRMAATG